MSWTLGAIYIITAAASHLPIDANSTRTMDSLSRLHVHSAPVILDGAVQPAGSRRSVHGRDWALAARRRASTARERSRPISFALTSFRGNTPLNDALTNNFSEIGSQLVTKGARLPSNQFSLVMAAAEHNLEQLSLMCLKAGVSADSCDYDVRSCLHVACATGNLKAVQALIHVGANVNMQDRCVPVQGLCLASSRRARASARRHAGLTVLSAATALHLRNRARRLLAQVARHAPRRRYSDQRCGHLQPHEAEWRDHVAWIPEQCGS